MGKYQFRRPREGDVVSLYLGLDEDGEMALMATGIDGEQWILLNFHDNGSITSVGSIPGSAGIPVDDSGRMHITKGHS